MFLILPLIIMYIPKENVGLYSIFTMAFSISFVLISMSNHGYISAKYFQVDTNSFNRIFVNIVGLNFASYVMLLLAVAFAVPLFIDTSLFTIILVLTSALFKAVQLNYLTIFRNQGKALLYGFTSSIQVTIFLVLSYLFIVYFSFGLNGIFLGLTFSFLLSAFFAYYKAKVPLIKARVSYSEIKCILSENIPLLFHGVISICLEVADKWLIGRNLNLSELAEYEVAYQLSKGLSIFFLAVNMTYVPYVFRRLKRKSGVLNIGVVLVLGMIVSYYIYNFLLRVLVDEFSFLTGYSDSLTLVSDVSLCFMFQGFYYVFIVLSFYHIRNTWIMLNSLLAFVTYLTLFVLMGANSLSEFIFLKQIAYGMLSIVALFQYIYLLKIKR